MLLMTSYSILQLLKLLIMILDLMNGILLSIIRVKGNIARMNKGYVYLMPASYLMLHGYLTMNFLCQQTRAQFTKRKT